MASKQLTTFTQKLLSLTHEDARTLVDDRAINHLVVNSGYVSLTSFRASLLHLTSIKSRKFAAKYASYMAEHIESNPFIAPHVMTNFVNHISFSIDAHIQDKTPYKEKTDDIRIITIDNSPAYTALLVGDSKHFVSCLRIGYYSMPSGSLSTKQDLCNSVKASGVNWGRMNKLAGSQGCNASDFLDSEVKAFCNGTLFYVGIGPLPFEGFESKGLTTRMRCVIVDSKGKPPMIILNRVYGSDARIPDMITKIKQAYPNHKIVTPSGLELPGVRTSSYRIHHGVSVTLGKVYSDYSFDLLNEVESYSLAKRSYVLSRQDKDTIMRSRDGCRVYTRECVTVKSETREQASYDRANNHRIAQYEDVGDNKDDYTYHSMNYRCPRDVTTAIRVIDDTMVVGGDGHSYYSKRNTVTPIMVKYNNDTVSVGVTWKGTDRRRYNLIGERWSSNVYFTRGTNKKEVFNSRTSSWEGYTGDVTSTRKGIHYDNSRILKLLVRRTIR